MNTTYLIINLIVALVAIGGCILLVRSRVWETIGLTIGLVGSIAALFMFVGSFAFAAGAPIISETTTFHLERTPYRVIVKAFGHELTFTDAYTVANADRIERVRLTVQRNAWGITHEKAGPNAPKFEPLFRESAK